jgi:hypothetical protein
LKTSHGLLPCLRSVFPARTRSICFF